MYALQLSSSNDLLDASFLESPVPTETQEKIVRHLWGSGYKPHNQHLGPYFQYYTEQCKTASTALGNGFVIRTHQHIIEIAAPIRDGCSRSEVQAFVQRCQWVNDATLESTINASIDLTVRILYMLDVGEFENAYSGREKLLWTEGSLQDFMRETFSEAVSIESDGIRLNRAFNVCNMVHIAGFRVKLTSNLYDHLRFDFSKNTVEIFHHASFLMAHRQTSIFPPGLMDETLATLALIFPQGDKETERWYRKRNRLDELDSNILRCGKADKHIEDYKHWHDRLFILKNEFDESRPSTMTQWWNDRRDVSQWYPLWVAISLTILFGLVQSIEGALQVYKAYNP